MNPESAKRLAEYATDVVAPDALKIARGIPDEIRHAKDSAAFAKAATEKALRGDSYGAAYDALCAVSTVNRTKFDKKHYPAMLRVAVDWRGSIA